MREREVIKCWEAEIVVTGVGVGNASARMAKYWPTRLRSASVRGVRGISGGGEIFGG